MEFSSPIIDWTSIGSLSFVAIAGLLVLTVALFTKSLKFNIALTFIGLAAAFIYSVTLWGTDTDAFGGMLIIDSFTIVLYLIILTGSILTLLLSNDLLKDYAPVRGEFLALLCFATFGMMVMAASGDLIMIFLGVETLSISLYILAGFQRSNEYSLEAALKYFLLGAFASGFLLYGMAYFYGATGTTNLLQIITYMKSSGELGNYYIIGAVLMIIGFGFKIALVPFHMWTPDVYEGAPTPITAFMSTGVKAAGFAVMIRIFLYAAGSAFVETQKILWFLAALTMTTGNIIALAQTNIKRMLAYSSIAHAGYMLVAFVAGTNAAVSGIIYYLLTYTFMNIGAFGVIAYFEHKTDSLYAIQKYSGMGFIRPLPAAALSIFMFSLAGIPPFAGFFAKFYAFSAAVNSGLIWLPIIGVINSVISVYFYLRVVLVMYMKEPETDFSLYPVKWSGAAVLFISVVGVFILGLLPSLFLGLSTVNLF
jgi:NADH-quinone oxidoreductase subunit N